MHSKNDAPSAGSAGIGLDEAMERLVETLARNEEERQALSGQMERNEDARAKLLDKKDELQARIDERDMPELLAVAKEHGLTVRDLIGMIRSVTA